MDRAKMEDAMLFYNERSGLHFYAGRHTFNLLKI